MSHSTGTATQDPPLEQTYIDQAQLLCQGSEFLPGGVEGLARQLQQAAREGKRLNIKLGLDPTRPDLHLGHSVVLRKFKLFQELGHQGILIIGDATAMIGDPSGRNSTRPPLTNDEIMVNAETYLAQAGKVIDVDNARIERNSQWLSDINLEGILKLASKVTVAQILVREDFANRYGAQQPISLHEFLYPLMQAYDSVMIDADIELGGTDQRFNNLMGRELQTAFEKSHRQGVLLMPLLEGTDGKIKMSKSYAEHCINLTDTPNDMFGKLMSLPDEMIVRYMKLVGRYTPDEVQQVEAQLQAGSNPRDLKAAMAKHVIALYHPPETAEAAEQAFVDQFRNKQIPDDIPEATLVVGTAYPLLALIADQGLAPSKSEARRLIDGGGVKLDGEKVADAGFELTGQAGQHIVLQVGKRKFLKLTFA
ncbi:MAG: tyrosine--tRNA ligase [Cyanobacteria bacterium HKST-UBA06]|nr:tyrosine--tRNA ligase [Cyanobacteria bacterium HKST-UBA06]